MKTKENITIPLRNTEMSGPETRLRTLYSYLSGLVVIREMRERMIHTQNDLLEFDKSGESTSGCSKDMI